MMERNSVTKRSDQINEALPVERYLFEAIPGNNVLVLADSPRFTIITATEGYLQITGREKKDLVGKGMFEVFPSNPNDATHTGEKDLRASFFHVIEHKKPHYLPMQRYDITDKEGRFSERYWHAGNIPVLDDNGALIYIIHTAEDITERVRMQQRAEQIKSLEQAHNLLMQAPVAIAILKGHDFVIELANAPIVALWGKGSDVAGKPLLDVLPEIKDQGFIELMHQVMETGEAYSAYEMPATLIRNGKKELVYFNFIYQPYYEDDKVKAVGLMIFANEVTERVAIKKELAENKQRLDLAIEIGELGLFTIDLIHSNLLENTSSYSQKIMDWFGLTEHELPLSEIFSKIHADDLPVVKEIIEHSIVGAGQGRHDLTYRVCNAQNGKPQYLRSIGQVQFEGGGAKSLSGIIQDVTSQVEINMALKESEERFRIMADAAPNIVWALNPDGTQKYINKFGLDYLGVSLEQAIELNWTPFIHPDDLEATGQAVTEAIHNRTPYSKEHRLLRKDGKWRWFLSQGGPSYYPNGELYGYIGSGFDITEGSQAMTALRESEQRVRSLVESAPFPIGVYIGREMCIELANQSIIDVWGKGPDVVGRRYSEILPELENQKIYAQLDAVYNTGVPFHAKNQRVDLVIDGMLRSFYFNYSFTPLFDATGNVYGVMNTAADVTDLALANQAVEKSRENLRNMILQAPVAMCILKEPEFIVEIANERMFELWGKSAEEVMHRPIFEGLPEAKEQGLEEILTNVYSNGETFIALERPVNLPRNGKIETTYLNFVYEPLYETGGVITGIIAVAVEVTEQVIARHKIEEVVAQRTKELAKANEALLRSNEELSRSNANLEEFAYAASHDLKEPIRKIHIFGDRLKGSLGNRLTTEEKAIFERMEVAAKRMSSLIEDLLSYSQVNIKPTKVEEIDMNGLIHLVLSDLDLEIEQKGAQINVDPLFTFKGHHRQLQQAFQNLIGNALKYSKQHVAPQINITCDKVMGNNIDLLLPWQEQGQAFYKISIRDNGIGFAQEDAERIFNVFTRLHGNTEFQGTGIGLSIVRKVIENHNGYVTAQSQPDKGATFQVYLPVQGQV